MAPRRMEAVIALLILVILLKTSASIVAQLESPPLMHAQGARDPESQLAAGKSLFLGSVSEWELQLIPGVSDVLSRRILLLRPEIIAHASTLPETDQQEAFELVHGVGPKTARKLLGYLTPLADAEAPSQ